MKIKKNVFIFTRPLQYLNIKGIVAKENTNYNILFVFANFNEGKEFTTALKNIETCWDEVYYINSKLDLLKKIFFIKSNNIYLSNDLGFNYLLSLFSFSKHVYVYEEGWATYMRTEEKSSFKVSIQKFLYRIIGSGDHIGNSRKTEGVIVYNTILYSRIFPGYKKKINNFKGTFLTRINKEQNLFDEIYSYKNEIEFYNKKVLIYATGWKIDQRVINEINEIREEFDFVFLKLHPHIKTNNLEDSFFITLKQNVMLEFYLQDLLKKNNNVTVFHDNSFSIFYFSNQIEVKNIGRLRQAYLDIEESYISNL